MGWGTSNQKTNHIALSWPTFFYASMLALQLLGWWVDTTLTPNPPFFMNYDNT